MGDYALPCFKLAKVLRKSPALIAEGIAADYPADEHRLGGQGPQRVCQLPHRKGGARK